MRGFPGGSVVKNPPASARDAGLIPDLGRCHMPWATKPVHHSSWAFVLGPGSHSYWSLHALQPVLPTADATAMKIMRTAAREPPRLTVTGEKPEEQQWPSTAENKIHFKKFCLRKWNDTNELIYKTETDSQT